MAEKQGDAEPANWKWGKWHLDETKRVAHLMMCQHKESAQVVRKRCAEEVDAFSVRVVLSRRLSGERMVSALSMGMLAEDRSDLVHFTDGEMCEGDVITLRRYGQKIRYLRNGVRLKAWNLREAKAPPVFFAARVANSAGHGMVELELVSKHAHLLEHQEQNSP
jgi:hypothetical protein